MKEEFFTWPKIVSFHNVRKAVCEYPKLLGKNTSDTKVTYKGKVKLHGSNAAIQVRDENLKIQSRNNFITPQKDNAGFATWVETQQEKWKSLSKPNITRIIFGEWGGTGINAGVSLNNIKKRIFAIFAVIEINQETEELTFIVEPLEIESIIGNEFSEVYVLPWYKDSITIDLMSSHDELVPILNILNGSVEEVEKCDPWVKDNFGIEGTGEGLVYYPISHTEITNFTNLGFKAKGEKHKNVNAKEPVQYNAETAKNAILFAELVVTEARLEQGVRETNEGKLEFDVKKIGPFLGWFAKDVEKECQDEMDESNLTWKDVNKSVMFKARDWFLKHIKKDE